MILLAVAPPVVKNTRPMASSFKSLPSQQSLMLFKDQCTIDDDNYSAYEVASSTRRTDISAVSAAALGDVTVAFTAVTTHQQEQLLSCGKSSEIYKNQHTSTDDSGEPRFAVVEFRHDDNNVGTGVAPHVGTAVDDGVVSAGDILRSATTTNKDAVTALYLCTWSPVIYNYESIIHTSVKSLDLDHGRWIECVCIPSANHCELLTT